MYTRLHGGAALMAARTTTTTRSHAIVLSAEAVRLRGTTVTRSSDERRSTLNCGADRVICLMAVALYRRPATDASPAIVCETSQTPTNNRTTLANRSVPKRSARESFDITVLCGYDWRRISGTSSGSCVSPRGRPRLAVTVGGRLLS